MKIKVAALIFLLVLCVILFVSFKGCLGERKEPTTEETTNKTTTHQETTDVETTNESCKHENTEVLYEIAPTCQKDGLSEGEKCLDCGKTLTDQIVIEKSEIHNFGEWHKVEGGACTDAAYYLRVCHGCGHIQYDLAFEGIIHPHEFELEFKPATCTESGSVKLTCKNCGIVGADETIRATGHNLKWTITSSTHSAYCRNEGCNYRVAPGAHIPATDSACTDQRCSVCRYLMREGIGHSIPDEYSYNNEYHWKECQREQCDYYLYYHKHVNKSATCLDETAICENCGAEFVPSENHVYSAWYTVIESTCASEGTQRRNCIYCDHYEEGPLSPLCHDCDDWTVTLQPTCTEIGRQIGFCKRCNSDVTEIIPALGHDCDDWTIIKEATCTENGERTGTCKRCGMDVLETIEAAHDWNEEYAHNSICHWRECSRCNGISQMEKHSGSGKCLERTVCDKCGASFGNITNHDFSTVLSYDSENHFNQCNRGCGTRINVALHNYTAEIETLTVSDTGEQIIYKHNFYLICGDCNYKHLYDTVEACEHYGCEIYYGINPTCTEPGLTWGWGCSVWGCGEVYKAQETIDPLGHDYVNRVCTRCGDIWYSEGLAFTSNGDGTCYVSGTGTCTDTVIAIPPISPDGDSVTSIGVRAFYKCLSLTGIVIPDSVTIISNYAFEGCSDLMSINIPDGVIIIGDSAFRGCSSLTSITIPDGVISIYGRAFADCSSLASINIPNNVSSIGDSAFQGCSSLTSITIPDSVISIGSGAFSGCSSLTSITIPDSVTSIGSGAFKDSSIPIQVENGISYVDKWVIECDSSTTIVALRSNTTGIANSAFAYCSSLTSITIPASVKSIGSGAFHGCSSLASITVEKGNTEYHSDGNCLILTAAKTLILGCNNSVIPDDGSITYIWDYAFDGCSNLTSINIPNGVKYIGWHTFEDCTSLTSINIPNSVTSIGDYAFKGCTSLTSINIPESVTRIGEQSFAGCSSLTSINIPNSVTSIGNSAFWGCSSLTSINIPDSVANIGNSAFYGCSKALESITVGTNNTAYHSNGNCLIETATKTLILGCKNSILPDDGSITSIDGGAFDDCEGLTSINIPDSVTGLGDFSFNNCSSLTSINIPNSVTSIGYEVFSGCSSLTSITIPDGVISIDDYAFCGCSSLTSINIPNSVTSIGWYAFGLCESIETVYYTGTEEEWTAISIDSSGNNYLTNANIIFNYVP